MAELNDLVMHRALTPAQHAVFIAKSFPCRPEGFAIVDAVAVSPGATCLRGPRMNHWRGRECV